MIADVLALTQLYDGRQLAAYVIQCLPGFYINYFSTKTIPENWAYIRISEIWIWCNNGRCYIGHCSNQAVPVFTAKAYAGVAVQCHSFFTSTR